MLMAACLAAMLAMTLVEMKVELMESKTVATMAGKRELMTALTMVESMVALKVVKKVATMEECLVESMALQKVA